MSSTAEFSLSSLESGGTASHPLAEEPTWEIMFDGHPSLEIMDTQIFGSYIAWKAPWSNDYGMAEAHLQVRNWKTGRKVWVRASTSQVPANSENVTATVL